MEEKNQKRVWELWETWTPYKVQSSLKIEIESHIKNLCELTNYKLKKIVWLNEYQKVDGLELICKETAKWSDFFNLYHTYMVLYDKDEEWYNDNIDVSLQTTVLSFLMDNLEAFGEKDGIFYVIERKETLLKPMKIKKVF